jgi:GNAT superfamily N-acetyltransferase
VSDVALRVREVPIARTRDLRQAILRPHQTVASLAAEEAPHTYAVGAFAHDELLAVGLIAPDGEPGSWRVRGMATDAGERGRGIGAAVLSELLAHAARAGATRVWCNARTPARTFYERAGFRAVSHEFEIEHIGPHLVMELTMSSP